MVSIFDNCALYLHIKTSIDFWCKQELNPRYLIELSMILQVELAGTHIESLINCTVVKVFNFFFNLLIVITRNERLEF